MRLSERKEDVAELAGKVSACSPRRTTSKLSLVARADRASSHRAWRTCPGERPVSLARSARNDAPRCSSVDATFSAASLSGFASGGDGAASWDNKGRGK